MDKRSIPIPVFPKNPVCRVLCFYGLLYNKGMRAHLKEKAGRRLKRRPSLRESLLSAAAGGRRGRDESPSGREGPPFDSVESAESDIAVEVSGH